MAAEHAREATPLLWTIFGSMGGLIFYGRFYVQWIASEIQKRSVIPTVFWYMSSVGSVMLLVYAVATQSPIGALGQSFNIVVYARNLIHIWREKGTLTRGRYTLVHSGVALVTAVAVTLVAITWYREYDTHRDADVAKVTEVWLWIAVGALGQGLFACRFLLQWLATEIKRRSVVPASFWYLSVLAATLQCAHFTHRREWVFAIGMAATIVIYVRNIWFVRRDADDADELA